MQVVQLKNANASVIAVTGTATLLSALLTTAAGENQPLPTGLNAININPEDGDIRMLDDGNTPTATKGVLLKQGGFYCFRGIGVGQIQLIRTGGSNVAVNVEIGFAGPNEGNSVGAAGSSSSSGGGALQSAGADAESNTASAQYVASRTYGFNGTTWDRLRTAIVAATSTFTGLLNVIGLGRYNSSAPTMTDGQVGPYQLDVNGNLKTTNATLGAGENLTDNVLGVTQKPLAVSTYSPSLYTELTQVTKANIKAATGNVLSFDVTNLNTVLRYFQLHNKATAPAAADVPSYSFIIPPATTVMGPKVRTSVASAVTMTAGGGNVTSTIIDINSGYGAQLNVSITNGATGPTIAGQVQVVVYNDTGHTLQTNFGGALVASVTNSAVTSWSIDLPIGVCSVAIISGSNTAQNCTLNADISQATAIVIPGRLTLGNDFFTVPGKNFTTGIGWAVSTTYGTFTDSATTTDHVANVHYI